MRLMSPLMTLMTGSCPETNWAVLKHVSVLVRRQHGIFDEQYKAFYCRHNDPTHVQYIKLDILPQIANTNNMNDIVAELAEYVTDINAEVSRRSIVAGTVSIGVVVVFVIVVVVVVSFLLEALS